MKREEIGFRELLERVLPLHELPPAERLHVTRALNSGIETQLQQAALLTIHTLEGSGALRRLPGRQGGGDATVSFQARDAFRVVTLHLPGHPAGDGVIEVPRSALPAYAQAGLDQVRRLLRLDDPAEMMDVRGGRSGVGERLRAAGRELLGTSIVAFHAAGDGPPQDQAESVLDATLAGLATANSGSILYCPDAWVNPRIEPEARRRGLRSAVVAGVFAADGAPLGHLEVTSSEPQAYLPEDLARIALLADYCGTLIERAAHIEKLVFIDPLTTVSNRSYFDLQAKNELARAQRDNGSVALCIADIDDFKAFNTGFGYEAGNRVLIEVAHALRAGVRPFDTVSRWGGEEFAVLLTSPVQAGDAMTISERLRTSVERMRLELEGLDRRTHRVSVTLSIGVALFPDHARNAHELWLAANQALLAAKRGPKNQVVFYRPGEAAAPS